MLCGLPSSGKSFFAKELEKKDFNVYSSDNIRKELFGDENNQTNNNLVFKTLQGRVMDDLKRGQNTIWDATNLNWKRRRAFLNEIKHKGISCNKICILFATPYEVCLRNNAKIGRCVPQEIIERMYKNFNMPCYFEGWDKIDIIWNFNKRKYNMIEYVYSLYDFNFKNNLHKLSLGEHLVSCSEYLLDKYPYNVELRIAGLLHDIGKTFVKDNFDINNEKILDKQYFKYQNVSAYDSLFYMKGVPMKLDDETIINVASLIQWHIQPYFIKNDEDIKKYKNIFGEDFYNDIMILHEADKIS